ncbi:hypothetical protein HD597_006773 [Nonomuraea thailandensis]|uniref:Uncharacterized protein n=1 Tax=Nonomuraea thailandensis TaxID=1188745 RepID=A0A9X2K460_9ACTN|nr:hypothetical protein [Nonomuraea thailandensis]MCP2359753.1 hypothetical protein [Nonomuraea thailandensis]
MSNPSSDRLHPAAAFDTLIARVRFRWPDATGEGVAAALQSRDPLLPELYAHARPELEALAVGNPTLRALLDELSHGGTR